MKNKIALARVSVFFPPKGFGFAVGHDGTNYHFHMIACRRVEAGATAEPEFTSGYGEWPKQGDEIVVLPDQRLPEPGKAHNAFRWGHRKYWDRTLREIAERPIYRIVGENRFKGQVMAAPARKEIVEQGMLQKFLQFPRGNTNDPFGTEELYRSGPCQRENHWQRLAGRNGDTEVWVDCEDPRPLPVRPKETPAIMVEVEVPAATPAPIEPKTAETRAGSAPSEEEFKEQELAMELEALAHSAGGRRAGTKTPRPGQIRGRRNTVAA